MISQQVLDDPSGNSFVENKFNNESDKVDTNLLTKKYQRTEEQDRELGIYESATKVVYKQYFIHVSTLQGEASNEEQLKEEEEEEESGNNITQDEVMSFIVNCPNCQMSATTNMKVVGKELSSIIC